MPTLLRYKGFRFFFYSNEGTEPPHVHIRKAENECKYWLSPVEVAYNDGMKSTELAQLEAVVKEHRDEFIEKWDEYFG